MLDGLSTSPGASSNTKPCICPVTPMPEMSPPLAPAFVIHSRIAEQAARHQSRGSCSAQPTLDDDIRACSAVAAPSTRPVSSSSTARVPLVPTSIPRSFVVILLAFFLYRQSADSRDCILHRARTKAPRVRARQQFRLWLIIEVRP